ncbi:MAG: septum site-determining protein MinC [Defluviitaleaceae bacterium]|nr:septum site-determining protein MinC [Defluviitaleaceae bacterium]
MAVKQPVMIKGQLDGINITLDEAVDFDILKENLRKKVSRGRKFFEGSNSTVSFAGREMSDDEEQNLIDIILEETNLDVTFIRSEGFTPPLTASPSKTGMNAYSSAVSSVTKISNQFPAGFSYRESNTAYYKGGLRSGQTIRFEGSVVIMGDINPGSEVVAGGNVVVLGALKGMAHAGAKGDLQCHIAALDLRPTQVRIADIISYVPAPPKGKKVENNPSYAYIKDGQVFVAPL